MPHKKTHKKKFFSHMRKECIHILKDIIHLYKNFIHWNISKLLISLWSIILAIIVGLPFLLLALIIGFFDPISWLEIVSYILSGDSIGLDMIENLGNHPYWLALMAFLLGTSAFSFLLASTYSLLLLARLSLHYFDKKPLKFKKNLYFDKNFITVFMGIICWNILYLLIPASLWVGIVCLLYLFFNIGLFSFNILSAIIALVTVVLIIMTIYMVYRIIFGYIILASEGKKKSLLSSRDYIKKSVKITRGKNFLKLLFISIVYSVVLLPFTNLDRYFENQGTYLRDTLIYKSGLLVNLEPNEIQYYEYITQEYSHLGEEEIISKIQSFSQLRFILFMLSYVLYGGLFVFILCSFYKRVLLKK